MVWPVCIKNWAKQDAAFHYVSSSPWQLYASLAEMCESEGFPCGSFHLRSFRLRDHMLRRLLLIRRHGKATVIKKLLKRFSSETVHSCRRLGREGSRDLRSAGATASPPDCRHLHSPTRCSPTCQRATSKDLPWPFRAIHSLVQVSQRTSQRSESARFVGPGRDAGLTGR